MPEHFTSVECPVGTLLDGDMEGEVVTIEPLIAGEFIKYHNNDSKTDQIIGMPLGLMDEALIHYSFEHSNREMAIQGVELTLTDPERQRFVKKRTTRKACSCHSEMTIRPVFRSPGDGSNILRHQLHYSQSYLYLRRFGCL